ncbi:hypothetical protein F5X99DRAFT_368851 [Biscogniauxia marginata]|nr:hypothetical protein F5X99DRAFT_368851 [Biscogniauxia marginata]
MCRNCQATYAASFSPTSMAITNPELIWSQVQEQKRRSAAQSSPSSQSTAQLRTVVASPSDAASTYSESTTFSYDKADTIAASKPKKSMRQRIKNAWGDRGGQPTAQDDRKHDAKADTAP